MNDKAPLGEKELLFLARTMARKLSHDLRSPFNSSISVLQLLVSEFDSFDAEASRQLMADLLAASRDQLWYMDLLLYWTRFEINEMTFGSPTQDAAMLLAQAVMPPEHARFPTITLEPVTVTQDIANASEVCFLLQTLFRGLATISPTLRVGLTTIPISSAAVACLKMTIDQVDLLEYFPTAEENRQLPAMGGFALFLASRLAGRLGIAVTVEGTGWNFDLPR